LAFIEGEQTRRFRVGAGLLLTAADGERWILCAGHATAPVDGIDRPTHARKRFTVGD